MKLICARPLIAIVSLIGLTSCTPPESTHSSADSADSLADATEVDSAPAKLQVSDGDTANSTAEVASKKPAESKTSDADDELIEISFDDIDLPIDADMVFRPFMMTERARALDGKRVRINGFMLADAKTRGIKEFILVKNTECKFGPGGQADHLVNVKVNIKNGVTHKTEAVSIEGVLTINPFTGFDGNTWSIFDMACDRMEKYRPRR